MAWQAPSQLLTSRGPLSRRLSCCICLGFPGYVSLPAVGLLARKPITYFASLPIIFLSQSRGCGLELEVFRPLSLDLSHGSPHPYSCVETIVFG